MGVYRRNCETWAAVNQIAFEAAQSLAREFAATLTRPHCQAMETLGGRMREALHEFRGAGRNRR